SALAAVESFEAEVDRLAAPLYAAGLAGIHLCGYSMGARIALGLLVRHRSLFARATLIAVHPGIASAAERADRLRKDEDWAPLLARVGMEGFADEGARQPLFDTQTHLPDEVQARVAARRRAHDAAGLARALRTLGLAQMPDYAPALGALDLPVHLVVGEEDRKF